MNIASRIFASCAAAAGIITGTALFVPATASAASYGGQCGDGYHVIDKHDMDGGTIFLAYNGSRNCVVTVRDNPGAKQPMRADIGVTDVDGLGSIDIGDYAEYAGPVMVDAKGKCIDWGGGIGKGSIWMDWKTHCG